GLNRPRAAGDVLIEAKGLAGPGLSEPVSFTARRGEIVGFFGLVGAGRSELMKLLYGAARPSAGHVELNGKRVAFGSPRDAVRAGLAL
ncbi:ATP-binding cassette domain-containing protein, partial [Klebsiella quasipneumoniae]|uniref:ATP-binding cassette domain-containing protein n=1 Tax=Klebsiella quasipneumoniae TaxID=1463165 RepID=UPI002731DB71